jgi:hypothetical protein
VGPLNTINMSTIAAVMVTSEDLWEEIYAGSTKHPEVEQRVPFQGSPRHPTHPLPRVIVVADAFTRQRLSPRIAFPSNQGQLGLIDNMSTFIVRSRTLSAVFSALDYA